MGATTGGGASGTGASAGGGTSAGASAGASAGGALSGGGALIGGGIVAGITAVAVTASLLMPAGAPDDDPGIGEGASPAAAETAPADDAGSLVGAPEPWGDALGAGTAFPRARSAPDDEAGDAGGSGDSGEAGGVGPMHGDGGHSHFRFGSISWRPGDTEGEVEFTIRNGWRRSAYHSLDFTWPDAACVDPSLPGLPVVHCSGSDGHPEPGDVILEGVATTAFQTGDGRRISSPYGRLLYLVTSVDRDGDWLFAEALDPEALPALSTTITHTYDEPGRYTAFTDDCCRLGTAWPNQHINNPTPANYRVETLVDTEAEEPSPSTVLPPVVRCPIDGTCEFTVPATDPHGDGLRFRLADEPESGIAHHPGPPHADHRARIDADSGEFVWDTSGADLGMADAVPLYSSQVVIEDVDADGRVRSSIAADFLIQLVDDMGEAPSFDDAPPGVPECGTTVPATVDLEVTFSGWAKHPDDGRVTLNAVGLPPGASTSPRLPVSGAGEASTDFSWTPHSGQVGEHPLTFIALGEDGGYELCPLTVEVEEQPGMPGPPPGPSFGQRASAGYAGDPVNTATGNLTEQWVDLSFPEHVFGLTATRTYNSRNLEEGLLGQGWSTPYEARLESEDGGAVAFVDHDGRRVVFEPDGDGGFETPPETFAELTEAGGGRRALAFASGERWVFDRDGRLARLESADGPHATVERDGQGRPTAIESSFGHRLSLDYEDDRLVRLAADDGREVTFAYDAEGRLASATDPAGGTESYDTDEAGFLTRITDPEGRLVITSVYDEWGRVVSQETPEGDEVSFDYDVDAQTTTVSTAAGQTVAHRHDEDGRLLEITDPFGNRVERSYDEAGNLTGVVDRLGEAVEQVYDGRGNVVEATHADGTSESFSYDGRGRMTRHEAADGAVTRYRYQGAGRIPSTVVDPAGEATVIESSGGLVTAVTDPDGVRVEYRRNGRGEVTEVVDGAGEAWERGYDDAGRLAATTSPLGHEWQWSYDASGRMASETDPSGATWEWDYDAAGNLVAESDPAGGEVAHRYDDAGLVVETVDAAGETTALSYDAEGRLVAEEAPGGATTRYEYGLLGRLRAVVDPEGAETRFGYDDDGQLTEVTDADGGVTEFDYDEAGRLVSETDPAGGVTEYRYDDAGLLVSETDPTGLETAYAYDATGRLESVSDPRGGVESYAYTAAGRLASVTDPTGRATTFSYDDAGRLAAETDPAGETTRYSYDADGRLVAVVSPEGRETAFELDEVGRVVAETAAGATTRYAYDPVGRLTSVVDAEGGQRGFAYDAAGRLVEAVDALGGATSYDYDARGNRIARTNQVGETERWGYDLADRVVSHADPLGRETTVAYDPLGRVAEVADPSGRVEELAYDAAGRVAERRFAFAEAGEELSVDYSYDAAGRRVSMTDARGETAYRYDGGLLESVAGPGGSVSYRWDAAGRRTRLGVSGGEATAYGYDAAGRLASVAHPTSARSATATTPTGWWWPSPCRAAGPGRMSATGAAGSSATSRRSTGRRPARRLSATATAG